MLRKLSVIILASALVAASLLVVRHRRIETAHRMSVIHGRIVAGERALWELRRAIAERCRPDEVRRMMEGLAGTWTTIPAPAPPAAVEPAPDGSSASLAPPPGDDEEVRGG